MKSGIDCERLDVMKKMISMVLLLFMIMAPRIGEAEEFTLEDAYAECCDFYPEFIANVKAGGVSDAQIITFLEDIQNLLLAQSDEITEKNFSDYFSNATNKALGYRRNIMVSNALSSAYPAAALEFSEEGTIPDEFQPLYMTMKNLIFVHELIGTETVRAAVNFLNDTAGGFFVSAGARAVVAVYDAEGILCDVTIKDIEADCKIEFSAAEGGRVKLMVMGDGLEPLCASVEREY